MAIQHDNLGKEEDLANFTKTLPPKLCTLIQLKIYHDLFETISMFKLHNYPASLYAWMTNNLRSRFRESGSYVYQDGDQIHNIYFLTKGVVGYALPRKGCFYAVIEPGDTFGVVDITHNIDKLIKRELK